MSFLVSLKNWVASGIVAGLMFCLVGCGPESTTPTKPREQSGSTTGGPAKKGRAEVPEPAPAEEGQKSDEKKDEAKPADEKAPDEKPTEEKPADEKKE